MAKVSSVIGLVAATVGLMGASAAHSATLSGSVAVDNTATVYLSSDLIASIGEEVLTNASGWSSASTFSGAAISGSTMYLLVDATNGYSLAMFAGDFNIAGSGYQFANGTTSLSTNLNIADWMTSATSFATATSAPVLGGANPNGSAWAWGTLPVAGQSIWAYSTDGASGPGHAYFVATLTSVTAVPEPTTGALLASGIAGLVMLARRRRNNA